MKREYTTKYITGFACDLWGVKDNYGRVTLYAQNYKFVENANWVKTVSNLTEKSDLDVVMNKRNAAMHAP